MTVVVPTGKNEPEAGLQLMAGMVSPFSPVLAEPQSPVPVGGVKVTTAPACPLSASVVMLSGVDNWQGALTTVTSAEELLLSVFGSAVVLLALAVLEITVPFPTASITYVAANEAVSP